MTNPSKAIAVVVVAVVFAMLVGGGCFITFKLNRPKVIATVSGLVFVTTTPTSTSFLPPDTFERGLSLPTDRPLTTATPDSTPVPAPIGNYRFKSRLNLLQLDIDSVAPSDVKYELSATLPPTGGGDEGMLPCLAEYYYPSATYAEPMIVAARQYLRERSLPR